MGANIHQTVEELQSQQAEIQKKAIQDFFAQIFTSLFDKSTTYTNLIISIGYIGFFTAWDQMKEIAPSRTLTTSALCMVISLIIFITWEVVKMIWTSVYLFKGLPEIKGNNLEEVNASIASYQTKQLGLSAIMMSIWWVILILVLLPAIIGTIIMLSAFITYLLG